MKTSATLLTVKAGSASVYWSGTVLGRKPCQPECDVIPMRRVGLIHHSDHGVQYFSDIYQNRLEDYGMIALTGSVGDSYDNALAETVEHIRQNSYALILRLTALVSWNKRLCAEFPGGTPAVSTPH